MIRHSRRDHLRRAIHHLLAALLLLGLCASVASAQGDTLTIEQGVLRLWPEYDDPGLLVIFTGNFTDTGAFPQQVALPIAEGARNIQATYRDASGNLLVREYTVTDGKLTYEVPLPNLHYEYYVDRPPSGDQRDITFGFDPGYTIKALRIEVQEPARSTDFSLTPAEEGSKRGEDGLTYHFVNLTNVAPGQPTKLVIRYTKNDSGLSKPQLTVTDEGTNAVSPAASSDASRSWLPYVLIVIGTAALVAVLVYWFLARRRPPSVQPTRGRGTGGKRVAVAGKMTVPAAVRGGSPRPTVRAAGRASAAPEPVFCTQCGHALQPADRFCAQCGAPRR